MQIFTKILLKIHFLSEFFNIELLGYNPKNAFGRLHIERKIKINYES